MSFSLPLPDDDRTASSLSAARAAAAREWDAAVIGAGPAGGMTALKLAQSGLKVVLIEARPFPRSKVCGGCLNGRAWRLLAAEGLDRTLMDAGAVPLHSIQLVSHSGAIDWPLPGIHAVSRGLLDEAITRHAVRAGALFLSETTAQVDDAVEGDRWRSVELKQHGETVGRVLTKTVVCADGLGHPSLSGQVQFTPHVERQSRLGMGATFEDDSSEHCSGRLTMVVGRQGYVGLTRVEGGLLNVAAALDRKLLQTAAHHGNAIQSVLNDCNVCMPRGVGDARWLGTLPLTRRSRRVAGERLFLLGDAAGYMEPFTGEGIAWALASAVTASPIIAAAANCWDGRLSAQWESEWKRKIAAHQWTCRILSTLLRSPRALTCLLRLCNAVPAVPRRVIRTLCAEE